MKLNLSERIKEIALDLTSQLSVVGSSDEVLMAEKVYSIMSKIDYFSVHKENLYYVDCKGDLLGRKVVVAELNGKKSDSKKTVVMIGHFDTVGISDYGALQEYATKPLELIGKLAELKLSDEVRADLESGNYMFGRGLFDMKAGVAAIIAIMEKISQNIDEFEGNIVFGAVCDEEGNSEGMLNFVPHLIELKKKKGYEYLAMLDPDYIAPQYPGDPLKYVYIGSVGKIMPTFYVVGKETHVGESFDGLDPNQIVAAITSRINLNPEFCDEAEGEVTLPPITLKQRDLKPEYSVQVANKAILFFNYATHQITPDKILVQMINAAQECFEDVVDELNNRYKEFCKMAGRDFKQLPWKARTISFEELYANVKAEVGDKLDQMVADFLNEIKKDETIDVRDKSTKLVDFVHNMWSDKDPVVIVYFTPPYYPHVHVGTERPKDIALTDAVKKAVEKVKPRYDYELVERKFLPCISDLSYATAPKDPKVVESLKSNTPGYGYLYELPIEAMQELDLPVADIGTYGKDAHKFTERIETHATFNVTPELLYETILNLLTSTPG